MKKVWIAIAAVVVIVAGYFIYQNNQPAPTQEAAQTEQPAAPATTEQPAAAPATTETQQAAATPAAPAAEQVLHRGNGAEPETMDPQKSTGVTEANIQYEIFEGLTTYSPDGQVTPGVAEKWEVSDDGKTYTFHLRDAKWSNGDPVTAEDFVYSLAAPGRSRDRGRLRADPDPIVNAEQIRKGEEKDLDQARRDRGRPTQDPEDHAREIGAVFPRPRPPQHLPAGAQGDRRQVRRRIGPSRATSSATAPSRCSEWMPQSSLTLVKNPNYYDAANVKLEKIVYYPTEDISEEFKRYPRRRAADHLRSAVRPDRLHRSQHEGRVRGEALSRHLLLRHQRDA